MQSPADGFGQSDCAASRLLHATSALALMRDQPSVIKRPVVVWGRGRITVGFNPETWVNLG